MNSMNQILVFVVLFVLLGGSQLQAEASQAVWSFPPSVFQDPFWTNTNNWESNSLPQQNDDVWLHSSQSLACGAYFSILDLGYSSSSSTSTFTSPSASSSTNGLSTSTTSSTLQFTSSSTPPATSTSTLMSTTKSSIPATSAQRVFIKSLFVDVNVTLDIMEVSLIVTENITILGAVNLKTNGAPAALISQTGNITVKSGGYLAGYGLVSAATTLVEDGGIIAVRAKQGSSFGSLSFSEVLTFVGNVQLSPSSLVRVWTAHENSNTILSGTIQVQGELSMAGELDIVDLNNSPENLTISAITWYSSSGFFTQVNVLNVTTEPCSTYCRSPCVHSTAHYCSPHCSGPASTLFDCNTQGVLAKPLTLSFDCYPKPISLIAPASGPSGSNSPVLPPASGCTSYNPGGLSILFSGTQCGSCGYSWTNWPACDVPICEPVASDLTKLNQVALCYGDGDCLVSNGMPSCHCYAGFTGSACDLPDCSANPCDFGSCQLGSQGGFCQCQTNWAGVSCSVPVCPNGCSGNGECIGNIDGSTVCKCDARFSGDDCSEVICPGVVDSSAPLTTSCSEHGVCNHQTGQCTCNQGWTDSDCSQQCSSLSCPEFSCLLGCSGGGECVWPGECSCDDDRIGSICQWKVCLPSSRAVFIELAVTVASSSGNPIDDFMNSTASTDEIDALANLTGLQAADICLTRVTTSPDSSSSIHLFPSRSTNSLVYPTYALDPLPANPLDCNTTCLEAQQAQVQLNSALETDSGRQASSMLGALGYAWLNISYANLCDDNCSYPHGYCRFGVCICDEWWNAPVFEVPRPPPTCAFSSCPNDCNGRGTCVSPTPASPQAWCNCSYNTSAGWAWTGDVCLDPVCPNNCTGHGQCAGNADIPWCNCTFGYTGSECAVHKSLHSTASESTLLAYQIATGACIAGALFLIVLIAAVPPLSRLFSGKRGDQIRKTLKESKKARKLEKKRQAIVTQMP